jgi:hypothetical protein
MRLSALKQDNQTEYVTMVGGSGFLRGAGNTVMPSGLKFVSQSSNGIGPEKFLTLELRSTETNGQARELRTESRQNFKHAQVRKGTGGCTQTRPPKPNPPSQGTENPKSKCINKRMLTRTFSLDECH